MTATATQVPPRVAPKTTVPVVRFTVKGENTAPANAPVVGTPGRPYTIVYDGGSPKKAILEAYRYTPL